MEESNQKISRWRPRGKQEAIVTETRQMYRDGKPWSWKYKWPDKLAMKKNLTEKQVAFAHEYLVSQNASAAYRASKGTLGSPELRNDADRVNGNKMKKHEKIMGYLREKIMTEADELLDIQMDMIRDEDTPAAVRNDAIKDRLNRIWLRPEKEESSDLTLDGMFVAIVLPQTKSDSNKRLAVILSVIMSCIFVCLKPRRKHFLLFLQ